MAEIVNLNRFRKTRARDAKVKAAEENRARFGRSKKERAEEKSIAEKMARDLEGHRVDPKE